MAVPLVYGAYGYTGELVAREAVRAGLDPVLAGRRRGPLREVARDLGAEFRVAPLAGLRDVLAEVGAAACLHCAGPFLDTYEPAVAACLATGTHYLDVTGEVPVFEALRDRDAEARAAGVMVLPGAGFDVVASDPLAARLHERLPGADRLTLALDAPTAVSPGTARTAARLLGEGVPVREGGVLRTVPFGRRTREIDLGTGGPRRMTAVPWGDVSTAHHTTGIPNIEVYAPVAGLPPAALRALGTLGSLARIEPVGRALAGIAGRLAAGPDADARAAGAALVRGAVSDGDRAVAGRVRTPEPYRFTAAAMVELAGRALDGDAPPGYRTPADAYGAELVTDVEGARFGDVRRTSP